ncbi:MAG: DUF4895 domain-containing protein [Fervidobacterium sp.]|uniref:DUF4895 domain-containing protein n=1 Tax=Fervidobacterium sp. TaxID=1871331 RepID=UPI0030A4D317
MYVGPSKYEYIKDIEFDTSELIQFLESKKERLDVYHRHVAVVTCHINELSPENEHDNKFPFYLNFIVTTSNEKIVGISISPPMTRTPAIYRMSEFKTKERFEQKFINLSGSKTQPVCQCGILKLPLKTRFIAISGNEEFLRKELFSEKVMGVESFSFSSKVDDKILEQLEKYKNGWYKLCRTVITDDGINFFIIDRKLPDEFKPLFSEVVALLRKKYNFQPAKYFPINEKVLGSFNAELNLLFSQEPFAQVDKLLADYEKIKKDILKYFIG